MTDHPFWIPDLLHHIFTCLEEIEGEDNGTRQGDLYSCSLVCRQWNANVTDLLYRNVCIRSPQLNSFLTTIQRSHSDVVRTVTFCDHSSVNSWQQLPLVLSMCTNADGLLVSPWPGRARRNTIALIG